jgi:hypothetical protein
MSSISVDNPNELLGFASSFVYGNSGKTVVRCFGCNSKVIIVPGIEVLGLFGKIAVHIHLLVVGNILATEDKVAVNIRLVQDHKTKGNHYI